MRFDSKNTSHYLSIICLSVSLLFGAFASSSAEAKYASIIVDQDTGAVLHERHADTRRHPASLTKIMTLYMVFDALKTGSITMDTPLKVSRRAEGMAPSKLGLRRGTTITVRDAIMALVTKSANDAAVVVAEHLGGTEIDFAKKMTAKGKEIGMKKTTFRNASGLYNKRQLSTARDMAVLGNRIRADFPEYFDMFSAQKFTYKGRTYKNHNKLLASYKGTDGIKTGYINAAGFNLVASVERFNKRLIGVVFGGRSSKSRDRHMIKLLDEAYSSIALVAIRPLRKPDPNAVALRIEAAKTAPVLTRSENPVKRTQQAMPIITEPPSQLAALQRLEEERARQTERANGNDLSGSENPFLDQVNTALDRGQETSSDIKLVRATPKPQERPSILLRDSWSIQVGAFRSQQRARIAAHQARIRLGTLGQTAAISIKPTSASASPLYRARLGGFTKKAAQDACKDLRKKRFDCVPFAPEKSPQVAEQIRNR